MFHTLIISVLHYFYSRGVVHGTMGFTGRLFKVSENLCVYVCVCTHTFLILQIYIILLGFFKDLLKGKVLERRKREGGRRERESRDLLLVYSSKAHNSKGKIGKLGVYRASKHAAWAAAKRGLRPSSTAFPAI